MKFSERRTKAFAHTKQAIRDSVKPDTHVANAILTIEEIDRVVNRLAKRFRDWYALANPELEHELEDHKVLIDRVLESPQPSKESMGGTLSDADAASLSGQAQAISILYSQREMLVQYLEERMQEVAPNITAVNGAMIGAKLIQIAGSVERLAMMPAGTIQLLGAETALFRHLRNRKKKPPKHGIIFNHKLIQRAQKKHHGKLARVIADCTAIAARVDYFKGEFVGDDLRKKVEDAI